MSFAACTLQAYISEGYLGTLPSDRITQTIDLTLTPIVSIISGLILGGIIPIDLPPGIISYIHDVAWAGVGISAIALVLDAIASITKKNIPLEIL